MKKWGAIITLIIGIVWTANWSYHQLDNAILITNVMLTDTIPKPLGLIDFTQESPVIYQFTGINDFWGIFTGLWPVWTLFILLFLALIPMTIWRYQTAKDQQIDQAKNALIVTQEQAKEDVQAAQREVEQIRHTANIEIKNANDTQRKILKKEIEETLQAMRAKENDLLNREILLKAKEQYRTKGSARDRYHTTKLQTKNRTTQERNGNAQTLKRQCDGRIQAHQAKVKIETPPKNKTALNGLLSDKACFSLIF